MTTRAIGVTDAEMRVYAEYKNSLTDILDKINEIGEELAEIYHVTHLPSDFKKKNGYKRSIELSHEYDLYRQNYCGCVYSRREASNK